MTHELQQRPSKAVRTSRPTTARPVLGEPALKEIAHKLGQTVRRNVAIHWTERENVRAHLRPLVKHVGRTTPRRTSGSRGPR